MMENEEQEIQEFTGDEAAVLTEKEIAVTSAEERVEQSALSEAEGLRTQLQAVEAERDEARTALEAERAAVRSLRIQAACVRLGIVDPEAAAALADFSTVDASTEAGIDAALMTLVERKPYLKATPQLPVIAANNGERSSHEISFTRAQLNDPKFWAENRAAIMQAVREGRITD